MRNKVAILFLLALPLSAAAGHVAADRATAFAKLKEASPGLRWQAKTSLKIDVNADGIADFVFLKQNLHSATVGVVLGNRRSVYIKTLPIADPSQESICAGPASIWVESLSDEPDADAPGFVKSKAGTSFGLGGGECDAFHFYWDAQKKEITWWRL
jgi:hypothetical protein